MSLVAHLLKHMQTRRKEYYTVSELSISAQMTKNQVSSTLQQLALGGYVRKLKRGVWELSPFAAATPKSIHIEEGAKITINHYDGTAVKFTIGEGGMIVNGEYFTIKGE